MAIYIVENIALGIVKKFDLKVDALKSQKQLTMMFGIKFHLTEFKDVWQVNHRK